ncbi:MAG TPA: fluoride efflux transporter CrcB [Chitinispirillaceae bacterium]|jgi:CrcB protein|nr:fluoride efflux transporter CrcB [Chitinispirillaceae bacterium]
MKQMLFIALGGSIGALARFGIAKFVNQISGGVFPWGTMTVNFIGLFVIGFLYELFEKTLVPSEIRLFLTVGFLGALTTFSTYGMETITLFRNGQYGAALLNIVLSNVAGLVLVVAGIFVARVMIKV